MLLVVFGVSTVAADGTGSIGTDWGIAVEGDMSFGFVFASFATSATRCVCDIRGQFLNANLGDSFNVGQTSQFFNGAFSR